MSLIDIEMVQRGFSDGLKKQDIEVLKNEDRKKIMASFEVEMNKKYAKINCCVLTDKLYNDNFDYIGIRKKNKYDKNKYDLEFIDEI